MPTLNGGSLVTTIAVPSDAYTPNVQQICPAPDGAYVYAVENDTNGRVYRFLVGSPWTITQLNTDASLTTPTGVAINTAGDTLYIGQENGNLYTMPVATGVPTQIGSLNGIDGFTSTWRGIWLDPLDSNRLICFNTSARKIYFWDLTNRVPGYFISYSNIFLSAFGVQPALTDRMIIVTGPSGVSAQAQIFYQYRDNGTTCRHYMHEILAGDNQTNSNGSGDALTSAVANVRAVCADTDGRVYFSTGQPRYRYVAAGQVGDLATPGAGNFGTQGICWVANGSSSSGGYLFVSNGFLNTYVYQ